MLYEVITAVVAREARRVLDRHHAVGARAVGEQHHHALVARHGAQPADAQADGVRITSYNVCYTKLLRIISWVSARAVYSFCVSCR